MPIQDISGQFQQILGRQPSPDELAYFNKFMKAGHIQPHEIGQVLQSTPEFQRAQLGRDTQAYDERLRAGDEQTLQRGAERAGAEATSRFAALGRPNSSALAASVFGQTGNLAAGLAERRQSALASFYGQGLQTNAALGTQGGQGAISRGYGLRDEQRQRDWDIEDYYRQQNDYNTYLNSANRNRRDSAFRQLAGGVAGGLFGGAYGGPAGAKMGAGIGSSLGGAF